MAEHPGFALAARVEGDVLRVVFTGRCGQDNAAAIVRAYFELVRGSGMSRILADIRALQGRLSPGQTYFLLRDLPAQPPRGYRTAVLEAGHNREFAAFMEDTGNNAGVFMRCFVDEGEALAWLRMPG